MGPLQQKPLWLKVLQSLDFALGPLMLVLKVLVWLAVGGPTGAGWW